MIGNLFFKLERKRKRGYWKQSDANKQKQRLKTLADSWKQSRTYNEMSKRGSGGRSLLNLTWKETDRLSCSPQTSASGKNRELWSSVPEIWSQTAKWWLGSLTYLVSNSPDHWLKPQQLFQPSFTSYHIQKVSEVQEIILNKVHALYTLQSKSGGHKLHS